MNSTTRPTTILPDRRARLKEAVAKMAHAIESSDEVCPTHHELYALAELCDEHDLPIEAARVRRWMEP